MRTVTTEASTRSVERGQPVSRFTRHWKEIVGGGAAVVLAFNLIAGQPSAPAQVVSAQTEEPGAAPEQEEVSTIKLQYIGQATSTEWLDQLINMGIINPEDAPIGVGGDNAGYAEYVATLDDGEVVEVILRPSGTDLNDKVLQEVFRSKGQVYSYTINDDGTVTVETEPWIMHLPIIITGQNGSIGIDEPDMVMEPFENTDLGQTYEGSPYASSVEIARTATYVALTIFSEKGTLQDGTTTNSGQVLANDGYFSTSIKVQDGPPFKYEHETELDIQISISHLINIRGPDPKFAMHTAFAESGPVEIDGVSYELRTKENYGGYYYLYSDGELVTNPDGTHVCMGMFPSSTGGEMHFKFYSPYYGDTDPDVDRKTFRFFDFDNHIPE